MFRWLMAAGLAMGVAGCDVPQSGATLPRADGPSAPVVQASDLPTQLTPQMAARNFITVAQRMEPQIEAECEERTAGQGRSCDYQIVVDDRPDQAPNAFQTLNDEGDPIVAFNLALIATAQNMDELAFVMGHEAAHHIAAHIPRTENTALTGALILGTLVAAAGGDETSIRTAQEYGASVGARAYSQDFELEADRLGTILTWNAGFDPERGALFFERLGDPGDTFLGTHPGNARRLSVVRETVARLRSGAES
ncbi:M48 family metalloprotease [Albirhodobacter sp. R86504]|uniref:M48 family metalloprotease n=1 Tax=Albirhodobacter sp. R86504 TaxID=3093848 RepID=UPI00366C8381